MTDAPYSGFRITNLWAFTQVGADDQEGICAFMTDRGWMPMIASDRVRLDQLRPIAQQIAKKTGRVVKLVQVSTRTDLEEIKP